MCRLPQLSTAYAHGSRCSYIGYGILFLFGHFRDFLRYAGLERSKLAREHPKMKVGEDGGGWDASMMAAVLAVVQSICSVAPQAHRRHCWRPCDCLFSHLPTPSRRTSSRCFATLKRFTHGTSTRAFETAGIAPFAGTAQLLSALHVTVISTCHGPRLTPIALQCTRQPF